MTQKSQIFETWWYIPSYKSFQKCTINFNAKNAWDQIIDPDDVINNYLKFSK
jgi:hypothetical protein